MAQRITKSYEAFLGLDLRASDLKRPVEKASIATNVTELETNTLTVRPGFQDLTESIQAMGVFTYKSFDSETHVTTEEVVACGENLKRLKRVQFTLTFLGVPSGGGGGGGGASSGGYFGSYFGAQMGSRYFS